MFPKEADPTGGKCEVAFFPNLDKLWLTFKRPREVDPGRIAEMVGCCKLTSLKLYTDSRSIDFNAG
jgi:hypothetical protein